MVAALLLALSVGQFIGPNGGVDPLPWASPPAFSLGLPGPGAYGAILPFKADTGQTITCSRSSSATYLDASGVVQTAPANACRVEPNGLLVEPGSTNQFLNSADFNSLLKFNATVTVDQATAPDGTLTADKIVDTAVNSRHVVYTASSCLSPVPTAGQTAAYSVYAKAGSKTWATLTMADGRDNYLNLSNCTVGTLVVNMVGVSYPVANGFCRFLLWRTFDATDASVGTNFEIGPANGDAAASYLGDGTGYIYAWGGQCEPGSAPTSYIPTSGTATARQPDLISINNPIGTFTSSYSVAADVRLFSSVTSGQQHAISTTSNYIAPSYSTSGNVSGVSESAGASVSTIALADTSKTSTHRWAATRSGSSLTVYVDGVAGSTVTEGAQPAEPTGVYLGSFQTGNFLGGWLRNICIDSGPVRCR